MSRLEEIAARVAAATPGPWYWEMLNHVAGNGQTQRKDWLRTKARQMTGWKADAVVMERESWYTNFAETADADFIAAARTDIPWLLSEVERRDALLARIYLLVNDYVWVSSLRDTNGTCRKCGAAEGEVHGDCVAGRLSAVMVETRALLAVPPKAPE